MTALVVVGGGVMGLFSAAEAAARGATVTVLERGRIGDPMTASYGKTRSYRSDYLDGHYVRLAREAIRLWEAFEADTGARVLVRCGCMNVTKASITPDRDATYAELSRRVLERLGMPTAAFDAAALAERFPFLAADAGYLEADAGVVDLQAVRRALVTRLHERGVRIEEEVDVLAVEPGVVRTDRGDHRADRVVVTAGHGSNDVLARTAGTDLHVPLSRDRPSEAKYLTPPAAERERFLADRMPVIAYLDTGIYLHPIVPGVVEDVKIGFYEPPDLPRGRTGITGVADFVEQCLPGLRGAPMRDVTDTDGCDYDLVADDDFVMGAVPGTDVVLGVGWRGTGYKFAPWVGRVMADLALHGGTVYDIARFDPARFTTTTQEEMSHAGPAAAAG